MAEENMKIVDLINEKEADLKKHNDSNEAAVEAEAKVPEVKQESEKKIEEAEMVKNDVAKNESVKGTIKKSEVKKLNSKKNTVKKSNSNNNSNKVMENKQVPAKEEVKDDNKSVIANPDKQVTDMINKSIFIGANDPLPTYLL